MANAPSENSKLNPLNSCEGFPVLSTSSTGSNLDFPCKEKIKEVIGTQESLTSPCTNTSTTSSSSSVSVGFFQSECRFQKSSLGPPNIGYELAIAKSIMQQYSTLSGDNLFDHLSDIIKRVIDERPPNVIDFFEEFSRNVREQKFHLPERFPPEAVFEETRMYRVAKKLLLSLKLPYIQDLDAVPMDEGLEETRVPSFEDLRIEINDNSRYFKTFNERVQQLQFYWNQCGFSISNDDIFQLSCAINRLQSHRSIMQCRFWGVINGLNASYYIVEASLTQVELLSRLEKMIEELRSKNPQLRRTQSAHSLPFPYYIGGELVPGKVGWENYDPAELAKMIPEAEPIPTVKIMDVFDVPPEYIGTGLNRFSYFVVNSLSDEWMELPVVTPRQIIISKCIKKFLTGDLENEVISYPCFPGKEKHYLRAMISRITSGTTIAPDGYYRKMTKKEKRMYDGIEDDELEEEEEDEEFEDMEDEEINNDIILLKNEKYESRSLEVLASPMNWVHIRPFILPQGRVVWFDLVKAQKEREKEWARLLREQMAAEDEGENEDEEEVEEEEEELDEEGTLDDFNLPEIGPPILHPCNLDESYEFTVPWIARFTSKHSNPLERILILQSNVWPGAYTFTFEKICESIYMGWGHKYCSRNIDFKHLKMVQDEYTHTEDDFNETNDPTVDEEEAYRLALLERLRKPEIDVEIEEYAELETDRHSGIEDDADD